MKKLTVVFCERTKQSSFPPYMGEMEILKESDISCKITEAGTRGYLMVMQTIEDILQKMKGETSFELYDYKFNFELGVAGNGWWATDQLGEKCKVAFFDEAGIMIA